MPSNRKDIRHNLRLEPNARMVEIGVYSTAGTSEVSCRSLAEFLALFVAEAQQKDCEILVQGLRNGRKTACEGCSEDGGVLVCTAPNLLFDFRICNLL